MAIVVASVAQAADYPNRPIRVIVPFAAVGTTDIIARLVTQRMGQELGQPVVVVNRGGAGGAIGAAEAARARNDGYDLSIATVSTMVVNPAVRTICLTIRSRISLPSPISRTPPTSWP